MYETHSHSTVRTVGTYTGFVAGLAITAMAMSAGFIWAYQGRPIPVYVAGFFSWTGYLVAHYSLTGVFVDGGEDDSAEAEPESDGGADVGLANPVEYVRVHLGNAVAGLRDIIPDKPHRIVGFVAGVAILVTGIAVLAFYVRQENFLLGNVGSGMFLGGYALAHYFETQKFL
jgi:hypothetical protein